jgi:hypothetical protein
VDLILHRPRSWEETEAKVQLMCEPEQAAGQAHGSTGPAAQQKKRRRTQAQAQPHPQPEAQPQQPEAQPQKKKQQPKQQKKQPKQQLKKKKKQLKRLPEAGRRHSRIRGLGNFERGPARKAGGGLRKPRRNPFVANWGTDAFERVGGGLQLAAPTQPQQSKKPASQKQQRAQRQQKQQRGVAAHGSQQQGDQEVAQQQLQPTRAGSKRKAAQACAAFMQDIIDLVD